MSLTQTALHTFLVQSRAQDRARLLISLAPPPKPASPAGRLFALVEYPPELRFKNQVSLLINQIMRHYEEEVKEGTENPFERNLEWTNRLVNQTLDAELWPKFNFLLGCLKDNHLQFASAGQIASFIIFKEGEAYRHLDLIKTYGLKQEEGVFFTTLISGDLYPHNFVVFCAAPVFDFLTIDRLKKILLSRPLEEASRYLEKTLSQIENNLSFGGIIISLSPRLKGATKTWPALRLTPDNSIRQLVRREQETEKILSPSLWSNLKNLWESRIRKPPPSGAEKADLETIKKIIRIYNRLSGWQNKIKDASRAMFARRPRLPGFKNLFLNFLANSFYLVVSLLAKLKKLVWRHFLALSPRRRLLFSGLLAILIIFLVGLGSSALQNHRRVEQEKYNQLLNSLKEKLDRAEFNISYYKNEEQASQILEEIKKDLANFPQNSKKRRLVYEQLAQGAETVTAKLRHLEVITPTRLIDLTSLNLSCQPDNLLKTKNSGFLFCAGEKILFLYDEKNKKITALTSPLLGEIKDKILRKDNRILFLNGDNRLTEWDPQSGAFTSLEITWPQAEAEAKFIAQYNDYLYSLDAKNNQIYKHPPATTGFAKGKPWLREDLALKDISSWAIDGNIYVAESSGKIQKFETGRKKDFDLSRLDPPLNANIKLFTSPESKNLFILDPGQKRVIIWNKKDQKLVSQFTAVEFDNLRDFSIDEKEKKIYVLNGMKVLSIKY